MHYPSSKIALVEGKTVPSAEVSSSQAAVFIPSSSTALLHPDGTLVQTPVSGARQEIPVPVCPLTKEQQSVSTVRMKIKLEMTVKL